MLFTTSLKQHFFADQCDRERDAFNIFKLILILLDQYVFLWSLNIFKPIVHEKYFQENYSRDRNVNSFMSDIQTQREFLC